MYNDYKAIYEVDMSWDMQGEVSCIASGLEEINKRGPYNMLSRPQELSVNEKKLLDV